MPRRTNRLCPYCECHELKYSVVCGSKVVLEFECPGDNCDFRISFGNNLASSISDFDVLFGITRLLKPVPCPSCGREVEINVDEKESKKYITASCGYSGRVCNFISVEFYVREKDSAVQKWNEIASSLKSCF